MCVGLAAAWYAGRHAGEASAAGDRPTEATGDGAATGSQTGSFDDPLAPRRSVRVRAVRIVSLLFLVAVATLAPFGPDSWDLIGITMLIAAGTLAVVFLQDLVPARVPDAVRNWLEAGAAIGFLTVLTGLSGGLASPYVVGFFLVVGAASLSQDGSAPLVLGLIAGMCFGAVGLVVAPANSVGWFEIVLIGFEIVTLLLLAYVGTVAGREQRRAREAALRLARFDPLTGLYNRTHFFAAMERELRLAERAGRGFALLMLDLDGLKPVNDTFGHHYGDRLLQAITEVIQRSVRATDTPARYGGDEFVILLPDTDASGGFVVAEKLRRDVAALSIRVNERTVSTSVSIGLVAYPEDGSTVEELMAAVDAALYEAKRSGKDRIVGYTTRTERVATRMDMQGRASPVRQPVTMTPAEHAEPPEPARPDPSPPPGPGQPTEPGAGAASGPAVPPPAPWETGTQPTSVRPVRPAGTDQPPVPRRRVTYKIESDPSDPGAGAGSSVGSTGRSPTTRR
jgi:diguanylate cyclase (GGDEF)-like protein